MAHKMRKFSAGGAQGKYDRRMADIEKDFKKDSAGKSGKALEVLEAKRMQRTADAEDDRAKRTGGDRSATSAAERAAERNLKMTRKFGAPKAVTKDTGPVAKITESLSLPKMDSSIGAKPKANTPVQKPVQKPAAKPSIDNPSMSSTRAQNELSRTAARSQRNIRENRAENQADFRKRVQSGNIGAEGLKTGNKGTGASRIAAAADPKDKSSAASRARAGAALSYLNPFSYISNDEEYTKRQEAKYGKAKGGKIMKYAKGGSTPPQPTPADRVRSKKQLDELKKVKPTPAEIRALQSANRSEGRRFAAGGVTKEMPSSKAMGSLNMAKGGMAKGGKAKAKGKGKGNPFAATKFGAAMMKKGADAKGRAMPKFAKGGSIDGCAVRGKTKAKRVTMKKGGSC